MLRSQRIARYGNGVVQNWFSRMKGLEVGNDIRKNIWMDYFWKSFANAYVDDIAFDREQLGLQKWLQECYGMLIIFSM